MDTIKSKRNSGFTIIELMIVLVIIAILLALAYPSYVDYVRRANRGEAQQLLLNWAVNQEIWRANNPSYAALGDIAAPTHDKFNFDLRVDSTATLFSLRATAIDDQANDKARDGTSCAVLNLESTGQKYSGDDTANLSCWE